MSVEDVMKVNNLAQELLTQGVVASREEAIKKAQEMLNKEIAGNDIQIKETEDKQNIAVEGESIEKLKNMIERTKEHTERQLAGYKNALIALEKEIRALQQVVSEIKARGAASTAKQVPAEKVEQAAAPPGPDEEPAKIEKQEPHPKVGNNQNNEDVSVEKIFYFGNK